MDKPFKCPHCGGSKFSVHSHDPQTVVCVNCGHRFGPASLQAKQAADKLTACFAWACTSTDPTEQCYFDACARWWSMLTSQNQDVVRTIIDVMASPHKDAAEGMAAGLPEAPKRPNLYPLDARRA